MRFILFVIIAVCVVAGSGFSATLSDELTAAELAQVIGGKRVVKTEEVAGAPLPRVKVYDFVKSSVSIIGQVFRDYPNSHKYVPGVVKAEILEQTGNNVYVVKTTSKIALIGETQTTVKNTFSENEMSVKVDWQLIESGSAEESTGQLLAEQHEAGCLMRYTNFLRPKITLGASLIRGAAIKEVEKNIAALKTESEKRNKN